jgi:hypothetical protein
LPDPGFDRNTGLNPLHPRCQKGARGYFHALAGATPQAGNREYRGNDGGNNGDDELARLDQIASRVKERRICPPAIFSSPTKASAENL